jgi:hypothetical protein
MDLAERVSVNKSLLKGEVLRFSDDLPIPAPVIGPFSVFRTCEVAR